MDSSSSDRDLDVARILLQRKLCTTTQVQVALKEKGERARKGESVSLGRILLEKSYLQPETYREVVTELGLAETASQSDAAFPPAARLGDYEIVEELGRGGMGVVYRARTGALNRTVALKVLQKRGKGDDERVQRFVREGRILSRLSHPNIIRVFDAGVDAGRPYLAMELVEGSNLDEVAGRQPMAQQKAVQIVLAVAEAVAHAHENSVVHRDLKPGNVLVDLAGGIRVMDFGLAYELDEGDHSLTRSGHALGTPHYMSPEQARGDKRAIDRRTDVYALGAILYRLLVGRPPFQARTAVHLFHKIVNEEPVLPSRIHRSISKPVEQVVLRAMAKEPADRYQDATAMAEDLRRCLEGKPLDRTTRRSSTGLPRLPRRRRPIVRASIAAGAGVLRGVAGRALRGGESAPADPTAEDAARQALAAALERRSIEDVATALRDLAAAGASGEAIAAERMRAQDLFRAQFSQALAHGELEAAAELLRWSEPFGLSPETLDGLRGMARQGAIQRIRRRLEAGDAERVEPSIQAARAAFGPDPGLDDLERWARGESLVSISSRTPGLEVRVQREEPRIGALLGDGVDLGRTPILRRPLAAGLYRVRVLDATGRRHEFPMLLETDERGRPASLELELDLTAVPEEMVLVPGGTFWFGPPEALRRVETEGYLIDRREVTCEEYGRYLASIACPGRRREVTPYSVLEAAYGQAEVAGFAWRRPEPPAGKGAFPVTNVTVDDAMLYALWAGKRLPSREEWERAARGVDGREFPWGAAADASRALLAPAGRLGPLPPGSFPGDLSPYGCLDMAGNVREWTASRVGEEGYATRGGSFQSPVAIAATHRETAADAAISDFALGFRCVRSLLVARTEADLLTALADPRRGIRSESIRQAAERPRSAALGRDLAERALSDPEPEIRAAAARALARHGDDALLERLLDDSRGARNEREVRAIALAARHAPVDRLPAVFSRYFQLEDDPRLTPRLVLAERHLAAALPLYRRIFEDATARPIARLDGAFLAASLGDAAALAFIRNGALAPDADPDIVFEFATDLCWLGDPTGILPLLELSAADPESIPPEDVLYYIHRFLLDGTALPAMRRALGHPNPDLRAFAAEVIALMKDEATRPEVERLSREDPSTDVRDRAAAALRAWAGR